MNKLSIDDNELEQIIASLLYVARNHADMEARSSALVLRDDLIKRFNLLCRGSQERQENSPYMNLS